jgi:hypothetical protein
VRQATTAHAVEYAAFAKWMSEKFGSQRELVVRAKANELMKGRPTDSFWVSTLAIRLDRFDPSDLPQRRIAEFRVHFHAMGGYPKKVISILNQEC